MDNLNESPSVNTDDANGSLNLEEVDFVWTSRKILTLAFVEDDGDRILLGLKKRGLGQGLWNGFGGKVEPGESIIRGAIRELKEESGLDVDEKDLRPTAVMHFPFVGESEVLEVHIFRTSTFTGEVQESEEMLPKWWPKDELPFQLMWPDDRVWFPFFHKNLFFRAIVLCKGYTNTIMVAQHYTSEQREEVLLEKDDPKGYLPKMWKKILQLPVWTKQLNP